MWSKSVEILNPYEATMESLAKNPGKPSMRSRIMRFLRRLAG